MSNFEWTDDVSERGVTERGFSLLSEGRTVPGVVWSPTDSPPRAIVLLGHGGGVHKRALGMPGQARSMVRHEGFAAIAIDAVGHGDRLAEGDLEEANRIAELQTAGTVDMRSEEFRSVRRSRPPIDNRSCDAMVADWSTTLDAMIDELGDVPVGYAGFSMGSMFGTPFVAADQRVRAAALGLSGLMTGPDGALTELGARLAAESPKIVCPVLFLVQADDEAIAYDSALAQFRALGSRHKRMHVNAGLHQQVPRDETPFIELFLASHLCGGSLRSTIAVDPVIPVET
jgi:dienelactone hydrolase